jgi:DNA-binding NarL/FixJ family response regulator
MRVLMLGSNPLFRESIESLICQEIQVEIVDRETSIEQGIHCIEITRPDVIILDSSDPDFYQGRIVAHVLEMQLATKVIGLNLNDNSICIYRGEQKIAQAPKDLADAIQS